MSFRSALKRAVDAAGELLETPALPEVSEVEFEAREIDRLRERLKVIERINREYFEVIEAIERERDEWKRMLFEQTSEHQNAQAMLQKALSDCSQNLRAAIRQLDWFRKAADLEPVQSPAILQTLPTGVPESFGKKVRELMASASPQTDGKAERARLAAQLESAKKS